MTYSEAGRGSPTILNREFSFRMDTRSSQHEWLNLSLQDLAVLEEKWEILSQYPEESIVYPDASDGQHHPDPLIQEARSLFGLPSASDARTGLVELGARSESDIVLMKRGETSEVEPVMVAGVVCFPSAWAPEAKLGLPMSAIHAPIPFPEGLDKRIARFLNSFGDKTAYERTSWGLTATARRNLHPKHQYPKITPATEIKNLFIRWEHQGFHALPNSQGVMFSIRTLIYPLSQVLDLPEQRIAFRQQLLTMTVPQADYKGVSPVLEKLLSIL